MNALLILAETSPVETICNATIACVAIICLAWIYTRKTAN